jgi:putative membrane protein
MSMADDEQGHNPRPDPAPGPGETAGESADEGEEPDVRFTYANERTFLAWNRTALALIATGVAATQLLPSFEIEYGRRIIGVPLVVLGAVVTVASYQHWRANERAMRLGLPLPRSRLPEVLGVGIVVVAIIAAVLAAFAAR